MTERVTTTESEKMIRTPPKKLNTTFERSETEEKRQPTDLNLDQDIIERNIQIDSDKTGISNLASNFRSVAFDIPITTSNIHFIPTTSVSEQNKQNEMYSSKDTYPEPIVTNINEKPKGAIPKLKRTSRTLDFSDMNLNSNNTKTQPNISDPFELPKTRKIDVSSNQQPLITSKAPPNSPNIFTQTYDLPKMTTRQTETQFESDDFLNFNSQNQRNSRSQNIQNQFDDIINIDYPTDNTSQHKQYTQFTSSNTDTHFPLHENLSQNYTKFQSQHRTPNQSQNYFQDRSQNYAQSRAQDRLSDQPQNQQVLSPNLNEDNNFQNPLEQIQIAPRITFIRRLKAIPVFRGETYTELRDFIDIVDTLYVSILNQPEEIEFYDQLILQIRGEARNAIEQINEINWRTIKKRLRDYFSYLAKI